MSNHNADGAIVHGVDSVNVEGRRLQNAGGEYDFVEQRAVVRVGGGRRHAPASAVDRLTDGGSIIVLNEFSSSDRVLEEGVPTNSDVAVIFPLVGISDLGIEGGDLGHRLFFGVVAHPRTAENVVAHCRE